MTVRIGKRVVPVVSGRVVAVFSAGRKGEKEAGAYNFWTAVCVIGRKTPEIFGRARVGLDAGERFRRIGKETKSAALAASRRAYKRHWKMLQGVVYVRPARVVEVLKWLQTHPEDAVYLKSLRFL